MNLIPGKRNNGVEKNNKDFLDMERLFESLFNDTFFRTLYGSGNMKVDIIESEKEYILEAELPGINKEAIAIDLKDDKLTISVQRYDEVNIERENYIRRERKSGSLSRVFYIPNVKEDQVKAKYENGILTVKLPKAEGTVVRSNRITIE